MEMISLILVFSDFSKKVHPILDRMIVISLNLIISRRTRFLKVYSV